MDFHTKSIDETLKLLECSKTGLTGEEVKKRITHYGYNVFPEKKSKRIIEIFIEQFKSPIIYILLIAALISFVIQEFIDGYFILVILVSNAIIGAYQEYMAGQKADSLKKSIKTYVNVIRDEKNQTILNKEITIGDIVLFDSGTKVAADCRLLYSNDLEVNESLLTGESTNIVKNSDFITKDLKLPVADRSNMLYAGSFVAKGRGKGVVTAIGDETEVGKIAYLLATEEESSPPLVIRIEKFSFNIAKAIGAFIIFIILLGIYQDMELKEIFFLSVALAVSSIPEALPVAITVALSVASLAMSKKNVIVRKLSAIEGLGSCTLIASDKTGTLTQNRLSVEYFITPNKEYNKKEDVDENILQGLVLCNEFIYKLEGNKYQFLGDQVDVALAKFATEKDDKYMTLKQNSQIKDEIPYEPENAFSASAYIMPSGQLNYIKGSIEVILKYCNIDKNEKIKILKENDEWAGKGFRNIALAYKESDEDKISLKNFKFLGFAAIIDPLRVDVKKAVKTTKNAGIEVAMITGDHPNTAYYIAKEIGIAMDENEVISGKEIQKWIEKGSKPKDIAQKRVFARVTPEHKQKIVKAFQFLGHFVAVTGDGVNDAPALKTADIGISMGKSGTDVAKESSDLILSDDSFKSIVNGIEEGRVAYDNIRKVIHVLVSTGFSEVILILLSMLFFIPIPLLPIQLLWLNLATNGIQNIALGFEKAEYGVLKRKPRDPKEPIFNKIMINRIVVGGLYMGITAFILFYALLNMGYTEESARNVTLLLMVLFENIHVFNSRSENISIFKIDHSKNKLLLILVLIAQFIHIISMHIPFMQTVLGVEPITLSMWLFLLCIALTLVVIMELEKIIFKSFRSQEKLPTAKFSK